jgi:D-alanyl-D-alanine carboxypeptidase
MKNNRIILALFVFMCAFLSFASCKTKSKDNNKSEDEKLLETLFGPDYQVFPDKKGECGAVIENILANKTEFLLDLNDVLACDTDYLLTLVDKRHYLLPDYEPEDLVHLEPNDFYALNRRDLKLRRPVEKALREMAIGALNDGIKILVSSCYRSYNYQENLFERYVKEMGEKEAERVSARPGSSQHQLGVAIDFGTIDDAFAQTAQGKWIYSNAAKYGFSLSFPADYEIVTGYVWECWHFRYIGIKACEFQKKWFMDIQQYMLEFIHEWLNQKDGGF